MKFEEIQEKMKVIRESPIRLIPDENRAEKCPITKKIDEEILNTTNIMNIIIAAFGLPNTKVVFYT